MSDTTVTSDISIKEEIVFDSVSVSRILGVQESTLRKYCNLMQHYNYQFNKNAVGHRIFYKRDVEVMQKIIELKNSCSLTLQEAVNIILTSNDITDISVAKAVISRYESTQILQKFSEFREQQTDFNKQFIQQLERQEDYIKDSIEAYDRKLMQAIRETQETKRILREALLVAELESNKKKKPWWKIWS